MNLSFLKLIIGVLISGFIVASCSESSALQISSFNKVPMRKIIKCNNESIALSDFIYDNKQRFNKLLRSDYGIKDHLDIIDTSIVSAKGYHRFQGRDYIALFYMDTHKSAENMLLHGGVYLIVDICTFKKVEAGEFQQ